jgi:hypothetical protein
MRKCRNCKIEIPKVAEADKYQKGGFCGIDCMVEYGLTKAKQARLKKHSQEIKERKEKLKTKRDHLKELQTLVNKYVRLRDTGQPCICCDKPDDGTHQIHAGHYRSVGSNSYLRFNTLNIHACCAQCNTHKSGNILEYRIGLRKKYGSELVEWLEQAPRSRRYSQEWIDKAKRVFKKKIKRLEKKK